MARRRKNDGGSIISAIIAFFVLAAIVRYLAPILLPIAVGTGLVFAVAFLVNVFGKRNEEDFSSSQNQDTASTASTYVNSSQHISDEKISDDQTVRIKVEFDSSKSPHATIISESGEISNIDIEPPYVSISTSGDDRVCKMCKQFDGKLFRTHEAPQLPLHPFCGCAYMYYEKPGRKKIRNPADFVMPAECTPAFCANAEAITKEKDVSYRIRLCEEGLAMLEEFLAPYRKAGWDAPEELPCVYWSLNDYMSLGEWDKAIAAVQTCVSAGVYQPDEGEKQLLWVQQVSETSVATLEYLIANPGTLQRNIYRKLCPPCDMEALKWFLAHSQQIRKEKTDKTNRLYIAET